MKLRSTNKVLMTTPEQRIFAFLHNRDGIALAIDSCKRYYLIYKAEAKSRKKKYSKGDNFRRSYVQSAWNYRKLLIQLKESTV